MQDVQEIALPNLEPGERAFRLDTGEVVVVVVSAYELDTSPGWLFLQADAAIVDEDTREPRIVLSPKTYSIPLAEIDAGVSMQSRLDRAAREACERAKARLQANAVLCSLRRCSAPGQPQIRERY